MAITYVGGQVGGRAGSTSSTSVNFSFTPQAGDLVIVTIACGGNTNQPQLGITGYTALTRLLGDDTSIILLRASYKFMGGTPDTSVTIPGSGSATEAQAWTIQCFRGVDQTTPLDVAAATAIGSNTGRPNPPSITPTTAGSFIVICAGSANITGASFTAPANYTTDFLTTNAADDTDAMVGAGYREWAGGTEDPAAFTGGTTSTGASWAAYTLALRPATTARTFAGDAGSFIGTGVAASLVAGRKISASSGAVTESGITTSFVKDRIWYNALANFPLSGGVLAGGALRPVIGRGGSAALTGVAATLAKTAPAFSCAGAVYTTTYRLATTKVGRRITVATGSVSLVGVAGTARAARKLPAANAAYATTTTNTTVGVGKSLAAASGAYEHSGVAAAFHTGIQLLAEMASATTSGVPAQLLHHRATLCAVGNYDSAGINQTLLRGAICAARVAPYVLRGRAALFVGGSFSAADITLHACVDDRVLRVQQDTRAMLVQQIAELTVPIERGL